MSSIRALLAEGDALLRASLEGYLQGFGIDVRAVKGYREIGAELAASTFDVLLIDADVADAPVADVSRSLRACSEAPLILLLADDAFAMRVDALDGGADDCLVKPVDRRELVARIGALVRRSGGRRLGRQDVQSDAQVRFNGWRLDLEKRLLVAPGGGVVTLSTTEFHLMATLVAKAGDVVSRRRLLAVLAATASASTERGVESSIARLRGKLGQDAPLIRTVRGEGFVFKGRVEASES